MTTRLQEWANSVTVDLATVDTDTLRCIQIECELDPDELEAHKDALNRIREAGLFDEEEYIWAKTRLDHWSVMDLPEQLIIRIVFTIYHANVYGRG